MKKVLALVLALALCLSLTACSSNEPAPASTEAPATEAPKTEAPATEAPATEAPATEAPATEAPATEAPATEAPATEAPEPAGEQVYVTYIGADPSSLDVSRRSDSYSSSILINTVESLVRTELEGDAYVVKPGDAESWEVDDTGAVWTFHLNPNAKWSDGQPITADQYVYSLQRSSAPETGCPNAFFLEPIKNFSAVNKGEMALEELGVKAVDEHTLEITLEAPLPAYLDMLCGTIYYPQRQDIVEKYGDAYGAEAENMVYSGPFKVVSWTHNSSIELEKNDQYWDADKVKLTNVTYKIIEDVNTQLNAFRAGDIDVITVADIETSDLLQQDPSNEMHLYPGSTISYAFFNCADALFQNANIRKAFTLAIDREEINEMCFGSLRTPTYGWVCPSISVDGVNFREYCGDPIKEMQDELTANGQTAKDLLLQGMQELNLGDDPSTLDVTFSLAGTSDWYRTLGEYLQQIYLSELGVNLKLTFNEWGIFYDNVEKGNFQIGFMGWGNYYNDPYDTLSLFVSSTNAICTNWANEEYDALINQGAHELDGAKRIEIYKQAEDMIIRDQCVVSPFATNNYYTFTKSYVKNFPTGAFNGAGLKYVEIAK